MALNQDDILVAIGIIINPTSLKKNYTNKHIQQNRS